MSVYSSDAFVWEKEQAGRALGRLVSASRSQTNLSIGPSLSLQSVCLSPRRGYINTQQWVQLSAGLGGLGLPSRESMWGEVGEDDTKGWIHSRRLAQEPLGQD